MVPVLSHLDQYASETADPHAGSMVETFRAIGYNLPTAIADIIDNSISAGASHVSVNFNWKGEQSTISIEDNGGGMNLSELIEAMRPGSKSPIEERSPKDLGRFGLGLKTASFSQARKLTVITKKPDHNVIYRRWDLDYVNETGKWILLNYLSDKEYEETLSGKPQGTIILWEDIDRLVKGAKEENESDENHFWSAAAQVKEHLAMVFHRYIEQKKLSISFNDREVQAWDPYLKGESATQILTEETLLNGKVKIKPYILPHHTRISKQTFETASGPHGWNAQQGFYIYRNERLLVAGDWLGMFKKEEHCKLARIMIEIPNTIETDMGWQIDIKKSVARPPAVLKERLKNIGTLARTRASDIYRFRGKRIDPYVFSELQFVWHEKSKHNKKFYQINREHSFIKNILDTSSDKQHLNTLLKLIEETVPVITITVNENEKPEVHSRPFEFEASPAIRKVIQDVYASLVSQGLSDVEAKKRLMSMPPLNEYPEIIETISK